MNEVKAFNATFDKPVEKRFSKVNGRVCQLKMKIFSSEGTVTEVVGSESDLAPVKSIELDEKSFNSNDNIESKTVTSSEPEPKTYSVATVRERLREAKFSPRQKFRRLVLDYKKFYDSVKTKITKSDFSLLKGLFVSDVMAVMNVVTPEVRKGKQINTLLGLSALGKELRLAGQKLQIPYRLAMNEELRTGAVSKKRWQDISSSYNEFIDALLKYVFGEDYKSIGTNELASAVESATSDVQPTNINE